MITQVSFKSRQMGHLIYLIIVISIFLSGISFLIVKFQELIFKYFRLPGLTLAVLIEIYISFFILHWIWNAPISQSTDLAESKHNLDGLTPDIILMD